MSWSESWRRWPRRWRDWSARRTIRQQLAVTATISLLLFFGSLVLFAYTTNRLLASLYQSHRLEEILAVGKDLRRLLTSLEINVDGHAASGRPQFLLAHQTNYHAYQYDVEHIYNLVADYPEERERFEKALRLADRWHAEFAAQSIQLRRKHPDEARAAREAQALLASPEARAELTLAYNELDLFLEWQQNRLSALRAGAEADVRRMIYLALFIGVLATLGTLWWTGWLARTLTRPLEALLRAGEPLAGGAAPEPIAFNRPPEMLRLAEVFQRTAASLARARAELEAFERFVEHSPRQQEPGELRRFFFQALQARLEPTQVLLLSADPGAGLLEVVERLAEAAPGAPLVMTRPTACPAIRTGRPYGVADTARQPVCQCELDVPGAPSYLCVPLLYEGSLSGLVCLTGAADHWNEERRAQAARYAGHMGREMGLHERVAHAQQQAMVDELTRLYNRRFAEEYLRKQVALSRRTHRSFAVLLLDLDHFKAFNDRFGHLAGDRLLRAAAAALLRLTRQSALAARWGGEEFLVIQPEIEAEGALKVAERLRGAVTQVRMDEEAAPLTLSVGVALFPAHASDANELLEAADRALYRAKRAGRNRVELAAPIATVA